jgi:hypothetical protein
LVAADSLWPDLSSRGCLSWNCPEPITNSCAPQVSKVVYNKTADSGLQLAQSSFIFVQITRPANLQSLRLTSSCKDRVVVKILSYGVTCMVLPYQFFCLPCPLSLFHTHKTPPKLRGPPNIYAPT